MLKEKRLGGLCAGIIGKEIFTPMLLFKHLFLPKCGTGDLHDPLICALFAKLSTQNLPKGSVPYLPPMLKVLNVPIIQNEYSHGVARRG